MDESVERLGKSCFDTCDQSDPLWKISDCYLVCYINTLVSTAPACATAAVLLPAAATIAHTTWRAVARLSTECICLS